MKLRTRSGVLAQDTGQTYLAEPDADGDEARTLRQLQAAAITYRIAFGPPCSTQASRGGRSMTADASARSSASR